MSNLTKLEFVALDISGKIYLSWVLDAEIHLNAENLRNTIKEENQTSEQDRAKAMIFFRRHLHEELKTEYLTIKDPLVLWKNLKERFEHQRTQYRERRFTKYSELISCLLVAEQNNELLMKNHQSRPTGSTPFPEVNAAFSHGRGRGRGGRRGRGCGRNNWTHGNHSSNSENRGIKKKSMTWVRNEEKPEKNDKGNNNDNICYRCGTKGHWSRVCRAPKHLVELYKASLIGKGKNVEVNLSEPVGPTYESSLPVGPTYESSLKANFDVSDFFEDYCGNVLADDKNV
ncbi:hypothetical protein K2173_005551 [Erythroxylum novogranatense]|uniref:CCHC-type domain-containing protein n=1 Tax=Erythroxylum novogranatense TaxID=1862640 RepID=A0AAV8SK64_9ROSI|nr:hypothetical protein K2173_005551 [Erythroxylum novogranatense]